MTQTNLLSGLVTFIVYGLGMALVLIAVTVALALGKSSIVNRFRSAMKYVNTVSSVILVVAGVYIVWFWGTTLVSGASALDNGAFRLVENLSQSALHFVTDHTGAIAIALAGVVTVAVVAVARGRRHANRRDAAAPGVKVGSSQ